MVHGGTECGSAANAYLAGLYRCFAEQTHPDRELLICDDSPTPSAFFAALSDPTVQYLHSGARLTTGEKRNLLMARATGEVIAFFDDDDHYAPSYLHDMLALLGDADLVKLSGWFALSVPEHPRHKEAHRAQKRGLLRMEFKRFVNTIILMPCQIVRGGHRLLYRLLSWNEWQGVLLRVVHALRC